jgi:biopolymer transport protein ExbD
MTRIYGIAIVALLLNGCTDATNNLPQPKSQQTSNVLKIKVFADGRILADDQVIDLTQVAQRFSELKESSGAVWYYREAA